MRKTKEWTEMRRELKILFLGKGITTCELKFEGCFKDNYLGFAHRHKRSWYYDEPELLKDFNQVILACNPCHDKLEYDKILTEQVFEKLRGTT